MPQALLLPEICSAVFEHLADDSDSLAAAARVCRAWFIPAISVLWSSPPGSAFGALTSTAHRELYCRAVRRLRADELTAVRLNQHTPWRFPNVSSLHFRRLMRAGGSAMLVCALDRCGPLLAHVSVGAERDWALCAAKYAIAAEAGHFGDSADAEMMSSSDSDNDNDNAAGRRHAKCLNGAALEVVASLPSLRTFVAQIHVTGAAIEHCSTVVGQPFRQLRRLAVPILAAEVPALAALLASSVPLAELDLNIIWAGRPPVPFVGSLARLEQLRLLSVVWANFRGLAAEEFVQLRRMPPGLQELLLGYDELHPDADEQPLLKDEHLLVVLSQLAGLVELRLGFKCGFSAQMMRLIGEHCRQLSILGLDIPLELEALDGSSEAVLFPCLTQLYVLRREYEVAEGYVQAPVFSRAALPFLNPSDLP